MKIAIIGAGISGLSAAFRLRGAGHDVVVLEAAARAGGKIHSERDEGFLVEHAANGVLDKRADVFTLARDAGIPEDHFCPAADAAKRRYLFLDGALKPLPASPPAFLKSDLMTLGGRLRALAEPFIRARREGPEESVHAFFARRLGPQAADTLADPFVTGIYAGDAEKLSVDAALPALPALERQYGSLFKGMMKSRKEGGGPGGKLTSFSGGMGELVETLAARLGDAVHLGRPVTGLRARGAGWTVEAGGGDALDVDAVVFATPAFTTGALLSPLAPAAAAPLAAIPYAPVAVVGLGYRADQLPRPLDGFGFLVPKKAGRQVLGVLWPSTIFPGRAPEGHVLLRVIIGGARDPALVGLDDAALLALALAEVGITLGGPVPAPVFHRIIRWDAGIPQYTLGHLERVRAAEAALPAGLFLAGNGVHGVSVADCVARADALPGLVTPAR
ncbi:MAG: protoporphyrinogen oxidase [Myxococcales bacterium]|nr:protoporphyrinogen oxidase [Myxococcales bacterium]